MVVRRTKRERIIDSAFELAAEHRWNDISLSQISQKSRISLGEMFVEFSGRQSIVDAFLDRIDQETLAAAEDVDSEIELRDRFLDLVMMRFEAMASYKAALRSITRDMSTRPEVAIRGVARVARLQRWLIDAVGAHTPGLRGAIKICGLTAIYLDAFSVWLNEDDVGVPRTMARLDRSLQRGEWGLERLDTSFDMACHACGFLASLTRRCDAACRNGKQASTQHGLASS
jgi:ubiquinone biosynthesis protein COQ9